MIKLLLTALLFSPLLLSAKAPLVLKKGMIISCPKNHKPVYKVANTIREGAAIKAKDLFLHGTTGNPKKGNEFLCDSVVTSWRGSCIHTNKGWLPEACQIGLRVKLEFAPTIE